MTKAPSDKFLRLRVTQQFKRRVARVAKRRQCGMSDIIRDALFDFVESEEKKAATQ